MATVMLAKSINEAIYNKHLNGKTVIISRKLDGVAAIIKDGRVISRQGNALKAVQHIADTYPNGVVGELYCEGMSFEQIAGDVNSKDGRDTRHIKLYAYDYALTNESIIDKLNDMSAAGITTVPHERVILGIQPFDRFILNCYNLCERIDNEHYLAVLPDLSRVDSTGKPLDTNICEGLMIRPEHIKEYVAGKRSYNMLRYVHKGTENVEVVGLTEAEDSKGILKGMLGSVLVKHHGTGKVTGVGVSNMPHSVRKSMLINLQEALKRGSVSALIEYKRSKTYEGYREGQILNLLGWEAKE